MKARIAFVFLCVLGIQAIAQLPPYVRNPITTNTPLGMTNAIDRALRANYITNANGFIVSTDTQLIQIRPDGFRLSITNPLVTNGWTLKTFLENLGGGTSGGRITLWPGQSYTNQAMALLSAPNAGGRLELRTANTNTVLGTTVIDLNANSGSIAAPFFYGQNTTLTNASGKTITQEILAGILVPPVTNGLICYTHPGSGYTASGGSNRVAQWNDATGLGNNLTNADVATSPWWLDNGVQFDQSVKPLYLPSTVTASVTNFSVFAIVESEISAALASDSEAIWTANSLSAALIYEADVTTRKGRLSAYLSGGIRESTLGVNMNRHLAGMVCNMNQTIFIQGNRSVENSTVATGTVTGGLLGSFNGARGWKGRIFAFMFYNRALQDFEILQLSKWANAAYSCKDFDANITIDGDSLSSTYGASNSWPQIISGRSGWRIVNKARVGHLLKNMITDAGTRIDLDSWDDGLATNRQIAIVEGGSNDIKIDGQGTNQIYTNLVYWCQLRSARGYRTIVTTILPREQSAPFETTRQALNALIRSNWTSFADGMLDMGGSTIIGDANDEANTVYYQADKIHLTGRGAAVVAEIARPVIEEVLRAENPANNYALKIPQWVDAQLGYGYSVLGPTAPALTATTNNGLIKVLAFDNTDELFGDLQLPHNIAVTNASFPNWYFNPHIHWSTIGTLDATHSNVTWRIEWEIGNINGLWNVRGTNQVTKGATNNFTHYVTSLGPITNDPPPSISAIFRCRITRPASVAQDYSNTHDVLFDGLDLHIPIGNKTVLGSREEFIQ